MQEVLQHPVGPLPSSLATSYGLPCKTNKAQRGRELEKLVQPTAEIPSPSVSVIDGKALLQKWKVSDHMTFGPIADAALSHVLQEGRNGRRIDVVLDVYNEIQYRSKVSYHPLAGRESRLERRESRLARRLKNWKYGCLNFSWDFSSLMLTVQQQLSKTLRYLTKLRLRGRRP